MYIVIRLNNFSLSVLKNDPKRAYRGRRVFIFYIKVIFNTIKNYSNYRGLRADIIYVNSEKEIFFSRNKVRVKFLDNTLKKKYRYLTKSAIITDSWFCQGYLESPFYPRPIASDGFGPSKCKIEPIKELLLDLMKRNIFLSKRYLSNIKARFGNLEISELDSPILNGCISLEESSSVYRALVHGDLWAGNIINSKGDAVIIDWDDLSCKSFTYDLFYYYFQECEAEISIFSAKYEEVKKKVLPLILYFSKGINIAFCEGDYHLYYSLFLMERMIKRYD